MSRRITGSMGDWPRAKPRAIEHTKGYNPFLQRSEIPRAGIPGNPVSYSERVFDERSKWDKERRQRRAQLPLDLTPREDSRDPQAAAKEPQISQTALSDAKDSANQGLAELATKATALSASWKKLRAPRPTVIIFVRKSVNVTGSKASWLLPTIKQEVDVLKRLSHSHIITIQGTYQSPRFFCIIMSPVGDEDLGVIMEDISEHGFLRDQRIMIWEWMSCLASALSYIHTQGVRHRDIKPANIIHKGGQVFMTDFGSCREFDINETSSTNTAAWGNTRSYSAPEVLDNDAKRGRPADIFSLGCVFLEIYSVARQRSVIDFQCFRERMGQGNSIFGVMSQETLLEWTSGISSNDIPNLNGEDALLRKMLLPDPDERPSAEEVVLNLKAKPCDHNNAGVYSTVYWPTAVDDDAVGEEKVVY